MTWCSMAECGYGSWDLDRKYDAFPEIVIVSRIEYI